jgi:membrane-associated phospholipid phosphatase
VQANAEYSRRWIINDIPVMLAALAAGLLIFVQDLQAAGYWQAMVFSGLVFCASLLWQPNLLRGLVTLIAFSAAFTMLMEAIAATSYPLADAMLLAADSTLGLSAPATAAFVAQYPVVAFMLKVAYSSVIPQTILVLFILAEKSSLWTFLQRFMLGALVTVCFFYFFPAVGVQGNITPVIAERFHALRSGAAVITWQGAQGIITFPSFHTAWAIFLTAALWPTRLRWWAFGLNVLMIASTVTVGGHYYVDVPAGALVALLVIRSVPRTAYPSTAGNSAMAASMFSCG